jgi:hypothetical protein
MMNIKDVGMMLGLAQAKNTQAVMSLVLPKVLDNFDLELNVEALIRLDKRYSELQRNGVTTPAALLADDDISDAINDVVRVKQSEQPLDEFRSIQCPHCHSVFALERSNMEFKPIPKEE